MKKGFFFSLDAIVAAAFVTILLLYAFSVLGGINRSALQRQELSRISYDVLASAERNGTLEDAILLGSGGSGAASGTSLVSLMQALPKNICASVSIYLMPAAEQRSGPPSPVGGYKSSCSCPTDFVVSSRGFVVPTSTGTLARYIAELRSCYK